MSDDHILSVSALTAAIRQNLEGGFPFVWVRGQVVNLSRPPSGHLYFSLRDEYSSLAAVWFKGSQKAAENFDPLTGEVYEQGPRPGLADSLENGQEVVCAGKIGVYGARGVYQLMVEIAQKAGIGRLHEEFELLRAKLAGLGYFAPERKRPLPRHPRRVAVVTAPQGAAVHDFLRIASKRGLACHIRIFPTPVQGDAAPAKLVETLERIWSEGWAELAVLIRGGGSLEDLWAFNNEGLAAAIFNSPIPILAGIGHEVDYSLADMTADVRAATPTHAAQLLWPDREEMANRLAHSASSLERAGSRGLALPAERLAALEKELAWRSPGRLFAAWRQRLAAAVRLLRNASAYRLDKAESAFAACAARLSAAPGTLPAHAEKLRRLEYSLQQAAARNLDGREALAHNALQALMRAPQRLPAKEEGCERLIQRFENAGKNMLTGTERLLETQTLRLAACNPLAPLEKGYALVRREDGNYLQSTRNAIPGETLRLVLRDGEMPVRVLGDKK